MIPTTGLSVNRRTRAPLRRRVKVAVAQVLHATGLLGVSSWRKRAGSKESVCVLGLHRVLNPEQLSRANSHPAIVLTKRTFERVLDHVARRFEIISPDDFVAGRFGHSSRPNCLLTFDDGWHDNYTTAFPYLRQRGIPAVILLATGFVGTEDTFWVEKLISATKQDGELQRVRQALMASNRKAPHDLLELVEVLKRMPNVERESLLGGTRGRAPAGDRMLGWDEAAEMMRAGIEFGGHTVTHPLLTYESACTVRNEIAGCKMEIEKRLRTTVRMFAYPNGDWNREVSSAVSEGGFECAFTTEPGWYRPGADRFAIKRVLLHEANVTDTAGEFSPGMFEFALAR